MPKLDTNASKMPGHAARTKKGSLRRIRGDTKMETLEARYKTDFDVRGDMKWETYKKENYIDSVAEALEKARE